MTCPTLSQTTFGARIRVWSQLREVEDATREEVHGGVDQWQAPLGRRLPKCSWPTHPPYMSPLTKSLIEELEHAPESVQREDAAWRHLEAATWSSFRIRERRPLTARRTHRSVQKPLANRERHDGCPRQVGATRFERATSTSRT